MTEYAADGSYAFQPLLSTFKPLPLPPYVRYKFREALPLMGALVCEAIVVMEEECRSWEVFPFSETHYPQFFPCTQPERVTSVLGALVHFKIVEQRFTPQMEGRERIGEKAVTAPYRKDHTFYLVRPNWADHAAVLTEYQRSLI